MSLERRRHAAIQSGRRLIAHGEMPVYRLALAADGSWSLNVGFGLTGTAATRSEAVAAARAALAGLLEVDPDAFDVMADTRG